MERLYCYYFDCKLQSKHDLSYENLKKCNGMMSRIYLKNGDIKEYYLNTFDEDKKVVDIWLIEDNDEVIKDKLNFEDIDKVESILYSHPRWGHKPYKNFYFIESKPKEKNDFLDDDGVPKIFKEYNNNLKCDEEE